MNNVYNFFAFNVGARYFTVLYCKVRPPSRPQHMASADPSAGSSKAGGVSKSAAKKKHGGGHPCANNCGNEGT